MIRAISQLSLITQNTIKSIFQAKVLSSIGILSLAIMAMAFIAARFTYGVPGKVVIDVGLGLLTLSSIGIAISLGAGLLADEIQHRTLYVILARSVPRPIFLWGKFLGLTVILIINIGVLGFVTCLTNLFFGGELNQIIFFAIMFTFLEAWLVLAITIFFSLIATRSITIMLTLSIWITGHAVDSSLQTMLSKESVLVRTILKIYKVIFPNFYKLNLKDYVIYQQELSSQIYVNGIFYAASYCVVIMLISGELFKRKNFD